ncbi:hypothetical protein ACHAXT_002892 [Thalassiosira profunda]
MDSPRRQSSAADAEGDDRTYVWAKLRDGKFSPDAAAKTHRGGSNVANKRRGAPTGNGADEVWGWAPGYYCKDRADAADVGAVCHRFTLLGLDSASGQDGEDFQMSEHILTEASTTKLLESGDIVLANAWEGHDFVNRLELGDSDSDESYNYDEESESDNEDPASQLVNHLLDDTPEETPPSNLIELTHLHEPSVVHALRHRYGNASEDMSNIYTDTGPILLAVNPFKRDESGMLYGDETVGKYRIEGEDRWAKERGGGSNHNEEDETSLPPHVYAVADRTFRTMMARLVDSQQSAAQQQDKSGPKVNQSVLVSGESGAGKTVTTKLLLAYLSKLSEGDASALSASNDDKDEKEGMSIERRVLESNPIMESFGNARTVRNDNSSRFGKYITLQFSSGGGAKSATTNIPGATLIGASIETYLLEKVRLVHQTPGERNFHVFYELFSAKEDTDAGASQFLSTAGLAEYEVEDFSLINSSGTYDRRDGVADSTTFHDMKQALLVMGFTPDEINTVFEVTAALLHASNLTFERVGDECALVMDNPHLQFVVELLGITKEELNTALCYYEITIGGKGGETHKRVLSMEQCEKGVEALIKATYGALFNYLVTRINASVAGDAGKDTSQARRRSNKSASISILDIFGFESFEVNSFEQLCINYCNEALQQQFNRFVLRNEQEEYDREGVPWSFISFPENQDVLDLIDMKKTGILNILHDQSRTPGASDKTFALAMYEKCSSHERFEADSRQVAEQLFAIHHYAGLVEYDVEGFFEKTLDALPKSGSDLLLSSSRGFVKTLAEILQPSQPAPTNGKRMMSPRSGAALRPTVGVQFSSQLHDLRRKIDDTSPHYIRCLKPNNLLVPDRFDAALIADQLRCAGVIEAVRVSRLGYPTRYTQNQFIARYRTLGKRLKKKSTNKKYNPTKALVHSIAQRLKDQPEGGIQIGKTKVFLKREAYDAIEKKRRESVSTAAVVVQSAARGFLCRKSLVKALRSVVVVQSFVRRLLARKAVDEMRRHHRSVVIQRMWRRHAARNTFLSAMLIARWGPDASARVCWETEVQRTQSGAKGSVSPIAMATLRCIVTPPECALRCCSARIEFAKRKAEARDLNAIVRERDQLRQEVVALRRELANVKLNSDAVKPEVENGNVGSGERDAELEALRQALDQVTMEKEKADNELKEVNKSLAELTSERDTIAADREDLKAVNRAIQTELNAREEQVGGAKKEMSKLKKSLDGQDTEVQSANKVASTDTSEVLKLKDEIEHLKRANANLKDENATLRLGTVAVATATTSREVSQQSDLPATEEKSSGVAADKKATPHLGTINPSVCTSFSVDMTETEEEATRLREENQVLRKQLELLRVNEFDLGPDDQAYDESVAPYSQASETENVGGANVKTESARHGQMENATDESEIAKLQSEIGDLRAEMEQSKRLAKYDKDDMARVNRSLREELEAIHEDKTALEKELNEKCEEFDTLTEDVDRFAETFATQHKQLETVESLTKKLQAENERLKVTKEHNAKKIAELEAQKSEWVGSEIGKLWDEIERLRAIPPSPSVARTRSQRSSRHLWLGSQRRKILRNDIR